VVSSTASSATIDTTGYFDISGERGGVTYRYWQMPGNGRQLTLGYDGGYMIEAIFDDDDNNIIGNDANDYYRIEFGRYGETWIQYALYRVDRSANWEGETAPKQETLDRATKLFQYWRPRIMAKHLGTTP
jgi:hypothetical protein